MRTRLFSLALLTSLAACDDSKSEPAPSSKPDAAASKTDAAAPEKPAEAKPVDAAKPETTTPRKRVEIPHKRSKPTKKEIDEAVARAKSFQAKLDAGRKASKAGEYDAAFKAFAEAREMRPHDARVLGESGYAAFKAGKLADARRWTEQAIDRAFEDKRLGALYYNLGLIADAEGDKWAAKQSFELSLRHRPNDTVEAKLAALGEVVPPKGVDSLDAYCELRVKELGCLSDGEVKAMTEESEASDEPWEYWCGCTIEEHIKAENQEGPILEAAILSIGEEEIPYVIETESMLAVRTKDGGWQEVHSVLRSWMKEFCDSETDDGKIGKIEFKDLSPAPGLELLASWEHYFNDPPDLDADDQPMVDTSTFGQVFCAGPVPRCARWQTGRTVDTAEWNGDWYDEPKSVRTRMSAAFSDDGVTIKREEGQARDASWKGLEGSHSYDELFKKSEFRPQRLR